MVEVTWVDSMSFSRWDAEKEKLKQVREPDILVHRTSGYLLEATDEYYCIAQSIGIGEENVNDVIVIPAAAVTAKKVLQESASNE